MFWDNVQLMGQKWIFSSFDETITNEMLHVDYLSQGSE